MQTLVHRLTRLAAIPVLLSAMVAGRGAREGRELTPREQALHVLNRLSFGARPGELDQVMAVGVDRWIEDQLSRAADPAVTALLARYETLDKSAGELRMAFPPPGAIRRASRGQLTAEDSQAVRAQARAGRAFVAELVSARVARAVVAERQLDEVMSDFWLNHFNVFVGKNARMRYLLPEWERETIRPHAMGKFRDLLGAVAHSPAMLTYLDNALSVADSQRPTLLDREVADRRRERVRRVVARGRPGGTDSATLERLQARRPRGLNENFARELLELHTLGVDGGYSQQDVIEVARALTGWTVRPGNRSDGFVFNRAAHDAGEKVILSVRFPAGRGEDEGERVLDLLARHPATARHIAWKLAVRLVSDSPPEALVERAASVFTRTDGDLRAVVRTIATSDEFFARAAWRAKVKSPFEVVVSAVRALGGTADTTAFTAGLIAQLGQPTYGHQAPDGWPEVGDAWMNTGAILARINFGLLVAASRVPGTGPGSWALSGNLRAAPREEQVDGVVGALLAGAASADTRDVLLSGTNPLLEAGAGAEARALDEDAAVAMSVDGVPMTRRRMAGRGAPPRSQDTTDAGQTRNPPVAVGRNSTRNRRAGAPPALTGLDQVIGLALGSPEFQRR